MTLIAHAGHWLTTIAYFVPVVVFLGWLVVTQVRDRRSRSVPERGHLTSNDCGCMSVLELFPA